MQERCSKRLLLLMKYSSPTVVWFRQDLRLEDNPAYALAAEQGNVIPLFIWDSDSEKNWPLGAASLWWLHHSLSCLSNQLSEIGLRLIVRKGSTLDVLNDVINTTNAKALFWNRRYEPYALSLDAKIKKHFSNNSLDIKSFNGNLLFEPWSIANKQGKPFQVFTPFWKSCLAQNISHSIIKNPIPAPFASDIQSDPLESLNLLPKIHWDLGLYKSWTPGTVEAKKILSSFLQNSLNNYEDLRDHPDTHGTSKLSPYLHFGEISPRMIWHEIVKKKFSPENESAECYLRQLGWREFSHHLLYHFPHTPEQPLRKEFVNFEWRDDCMGLAAWQKGVTGYPFVDAGMRQLWYSGWMHNRVRMVVGSFLVKDLRISWVEGAKWFWDTLVDADLANNTLGWQWVGGCGADAAPYFRIFNPITQGEKFDPEGNYIRKWIPELASLPNQWIHRPWEAPPLILRQSGVILGKTYPYPILDHAKARIDALAAFQACR